MHFFIMTDVIQNSSSKKFLFIAILFLVFCLFVAQYVPYGHILVYIKTDSHLQIRIYCFILTAPKYFDTRARAVNLTWAPRCDNFTFISEYSNDTKGLAIAPIANLTPGYHHLTQKTSSALVYLYEHFINDFDWFVKADDDTYLFVDNLRTFLKEKNSSEPVTFGYNIKISAPQGFHHGGAGYALSREAVKRFYQAYHEPNTSCGKKDGSDEDVRIATCLRSKGVYPGKSIDENNRERFHSQTFSDNFFGRTHYWLRTALENKPEMGLKCCSNTTISFHYVLPEDQYLIDKVHYRFTDKR